jgi:hypothetical protein
MQMRIYLEKPNCVIPDWEAWARENGAGEKTELGRIILRTLRLASERKVGISKIRTVYCESGVSAGLSLSDYGFCHDDRACEPQPVASRLGPRFHPWQPERTGEEGWKECRRYAALIRGIRAHGGPVAPSAAAPSESNLSSPRSETPIPQSVALFRNEVTRRAPLPMKADRTTSPSCVGGASRNSLAKRFPNWDFCLDSH